MKWKTIGSAPQDGREVLISCEQGIRVARYSPWALNDRATHKMWWYIPMSKEPYSGGTYAVKPTHWMPLPEKPK